VVAGDGAGHAAPHVRRRHDRRRRMLMVRRSVVPAAADNTGDQAMLTARPPLP
jgi:Na+-transporting NADH:ubiquinone oxidoreductase subunit NqrB